MVSIMSDFLLLLLFVLAWACRRISTNEYFRAGGEREKESSINEKGSRQNHCKTQICKVHLSDLLRQWPISSIWRFRWRNQDLWTQRTIQQLMFIFSVHCLLFRLSTFRHIWGNITVISELYHEKFKAKLHTGSESVLTAESSLASEALLSRPARWQTQCSSKEHSGI